MFSQRSAIIPIPAAPIVTLKHPATVHSKNIIKPDKNFENTTYVSPCLLPVPSESEHTMPTHEIVYPDRCRIWFNGKFWNDQEFDAQNSCYDLTDAAKCQENHEPCTLEHFSPDDSGFHEPCELPHVVIESAQVTFLRMLHSLSGTRRQPTKLQLNSTVQSHGVPAGTVVFSSSGVIFVHQTDFNMTSPFSIPADRVIVLSL